MKILGLDSSGLVASVAIAEDDNLLGEYTVNYKKTHSQTLLPMLDEVARMIELDLSSIDAIAVAGGPGSFTGLRIGSATAKGLGLALEKPILNVPTVDALAYNLVGHRDMVCPLMDARRNQTYTGLYRFDGNDMQVLRGECAVGIDEIAADINSRGEAVVFLGDGVPVYENVLAEKLTVPYSFAPAYMNRQRAAVVGTLAIQYYKSGKFETAEEHRPDYLRVSQAERERAQREKEAEIIVRELKVEDSAAVAEMEQQIFSDSWSEKSVLETVQQKQSVCFAAEKAGHLLGYLLAYHAADEAEIARIAVQKEARRQGAAGKLMQALEHYCEEHKMEKLLLDVRESNEAARSFYTKNGFVEDGIRQGFYVNPSEDAVLMSRQLGADV